MGQAIKPAPPGGRHENNVAVDEKFDVLLVFEESMEE